MSTTTPDDAAARARAAFQAQQPFTLARVLREAGGELAWNVAVDQAGKTVPLVHAAVVADYGEVVRLAVQPESIRNDPARMGGLLRLAINEHRLSIVCMLIDAGADPNRPLQGRTLPDLIHVLDAGEWAIAWALLDGGADPRVSARDGTTPVSALLDAINKSRKRETSAYPLIHELGRRGAELNQTAETSRHCVVRAIRMHSLRLACELVRAGASIEDAAIGGQGLDALIASEGLDVAEIRGLLLGAAMQRAAQQASAAHAEAPIETEAQQPSTPSPGARRGGRRV